MLMPSSRRPDGARPPQRRLTRGAGPAAAAVLVVLAVAMLACGCRFQGGAGSLRAQSLRDQAVVLPGRFSTAVYRFDQAQGTSIILSSIAPRHVIDGRLVNGQILHIDLLWLPKAGATPMDASATNAMIRHVVIANGEVGVYGGAGFAMPDGSPAHGGSLRVTLRDASLQLQDATPGFVDLLSPAELTGSFTAKRDDRAARQLLHSASQMVTNALGRTQYVQAQ